MALKDCFGGHPYEVGADGHVYRPWRPYPEVKLPPRVPERPVFHLTSISNDDRGAFGACKVEITLTHKLTYQQMDAIFHNFAQKALTWVTVDELQELENFRADPRTKRLLAEREKAREEEAILRMMAL